MLVRWYEQLFGQAGPVCIIPTILNFLDSRNTQANTSHRAQTLKALLESYLSQPEKVIPDLQQQAASLANIVVSDAERSSAAAENKRPTSKWSNTA
jgi:hypothetical protein